MKFGPLSLRLTGAALLFLAAAPGEAANRKLFEKIGKWEVERDFAVDGPHACLAAKLYKDKSDEDAENAIVLKREEGAIVISLGYENWGWDKKEEVEVAFLLDKRMVLKDSKWTGDDTILVTSFPDKILPDLVGAKKIVLRFSDGDADFDLAGLPDAYDALKRCDAAASVAADLGRAVAPAPAPQIAAAPPAAAPAPQVAAVPPAATTQAAAPLPVAPATPSAAAVPAAQPAPAAAPVSPALPNKERIAVYFFGSMVQEALKTCDIRSTGKQRMDLDAKLASMKAEMAPVEAEIRQSVKEALAAKPCPGGADLAKVERTLQNFIDKSPEAFAAQMETEAAAASKEAAAGANP
ncbi:hypothetical protein J2X36_000861 [Methylobacterium sp. BE186]|uniref:hypothetical protein n=1 Tax=Methylobacterium sp. BE186 TaxID=2817715 RepID=UPI00285E7577|nr:hypothetical protein [Methylobacterium sp. BE186]MDR7036123.1 hypothetical protein [Methylobacterium sp. BE186]